MTRGVSVVAAVGALAVTGLIAWLVSGSDSGTAILLASALVALIAATALVAILRLDRSRLGRRGRETIWVVPVVLSSILVLVAALGQGMIMTAIACALIALASLAFWVRSTSPAPTEHRG